LVALALTAASANAAFGIAAFDGEVAANRAGDPYTQAGGHPFEVSTDIDFNAHEEQIELLPGFPITASVPDADVKTIRVDLPPGLVGSPGAIPQCDPVDFFSGSDGSNCGNETQVGTSEIRTPFAPPYTVPVYSIRPTSPDLPAEFGFEYAKVRVVLEASVRSGSDYGITVTVPNISQGIQISGSSLTFWGIPADPAHDDQRCKQMVSGVCQGAPGGTDGPNSVSLEPKAFMTLPTACTPPNTGLETVISADSWSAPGIFDQSSFFSHVPPGYPGTPDTWGHQQGPEGCDKIPFDPSVSVQPLNRAAGKPTGLDVDIDISQDGLETPGAIASGHLKRASVRLPVGMSISPAAADGLLACTDAQAGFGTTDEPGCPAASKVGDVTIDTPLLADQLRGAIYIGEPRPGSIFRLVLVARGPGVVLKLPGVVTPDPRTGQLTTTFDNNPQLPFSNLHLRFKGGPRAPLTNPTACGTHTTTSELTSWSGKTSTTSSSFALSRDGNGQPCPPRGFTPDFSGGLTNPTAGSSSTFSLTFGRDDEDQTLRDVTVTTPKGLTGVIASADLCPDALANSGGCSGRSQVGTTTTGAGAGSNPFFLGGRVFITGPYKGAPFGMSIVVPAIAGPFDLGTVVVRAAIFVDRETAQLRVVADPLPTILEGVPLLLRTVNVSIDKPGFMLAPTSCEADRIAASLGSNEGSVVAVSSRFQVGNCGALPFAPKMSLRVGSRGKLTRGRRTPLEVTLSMTRGQANNRFVRVTLPKSLNARLDVVNRRVACSIEQFQADECPRAVGNATAVTPLLRDPLKGPAYFVYNPARRLPDLVVRLRGQVAVDLTGKVTITRDLRLQTTFDSVPDVPITRFRLALESGARNGPIGITRNLCLAETRKSLRANLVLTAQSNRKVTREQKIGVAGCGRVTARRGARSKRVARKPRM
jgi:hypothetical protein